ncbi:MAG: cation diffusion facilitator family transporter, partial [Planctomycetes bacterium]|nr:cation diffusion facilitator family transporter [Planctomycetota bacterium]
FGYGKIEYISQVCISAFMIIGCIYLFVDSAIVIGTGTIIVPHWVVFFTAIVSALFNAVMYKFSSCGAKELKSPTLKAHAEHNKIDIASSILVAIGVLATRNGMEWVDPVIAIIECAHVLYGSTKIFWSGYKGIMDANLPPVEIATITRMTMEIPEVVRVESARARESGHRIFLDMVVRLAPHLTVADSKRIGNSLRTHLRSNNENLTNIHVQFIPAGEAK